ncbi:MAG: accessory gene regulator ArgB-like protein [Coprobacillaceae bacterium]
MVTYLSTTITDFLISNDIIDQSQYKIYHYGVLTLLVNLISVIEILVLGLITNTLYIAIIYMISFVILRSFAGGFHFKHYIPCNVTYGCIYLLCSYSYLHISNNEVILNVICLLSLLVIYVMSPVVHINKPLDEHKKKRNRIITIIISIVLFGLSFAGMSFGIMKYVLISTALLQLITRREKNYVT